MSSYLITGCSRGLGLELVKQLLLAPPSSVSTVIATSRSPSPSALLDKQIKGSKGRVYHVQLDVNDSKSIQSAAQHARRILDGRGLDVLVNNAGIMFADRDGIGAMHGLQTLLDTNVVSADNVSGAFLPLLHQGREKKIVNITSTLGSMGLNDSYARNLPFPAYKISKAALNMLTIQYANHLEAKGFTVFCISPGWLRTDLGGAGADLAPDVGAKATMDIIYSATRADNGAFRDIYVPGEHRYTGENPPW